MNQHYSAEYFTEYSREVWVTLASNATAIRWKATARRGIFGVQSGPAPALSVVAAGSSRMTEPLTFDRKFTPLCAQLLHHFTRYLTA